MTFTERMAEQSCEPAPYAPEVKPKRGKWTAAEIKKLKREFPTKTAVALAVEMGRTRGSVQSKAEELEIKKIFRRDNTAFLDGVLAEYANSSASQIADRRGVTEVCVRKWLAMARGWMP